MVNQIYKWAKLIKNIGLLLGFPIVISVGIYFYNERVELLMAERKFIIEQCESEKRLRNEAFEIEKQTLIKSIKNLEQEIRLHKLYSCDNTMSSIKSQKEYYLSIINDLKTKPKNNKNQHIEYTFKKSEGFRVILQWGKFPKDLDIHLFYGEYHVYPNPDHLISKDKTAKIDRDDKSSYGPETLSVRWLINETYLCLVDNIIYENCKKESSKALSNSGAQITFYVGNKHIFTLSIPINKIGNKWIVFTIDPSGNLKIINTVLEL